MSLCLGIDTSNYTTSAALYDSCTGTYESARKLLPVKQGERGLRQSDAVFHHTVQLPELIEQVLYGKKPEVIGVSVTPTQKSGSYMPCFLTGQACARAAAAACGARLVRFSHQQGHIAAALYGAGMQQLHKTELLAFHVSGGTTQLVLVSPDEGCVIFAREVAGSLDLNAGQAVDRLGVKLGMGFPAGRELDALSLQSQKDYFDTAGVRLIGDDCSLSGLENKCGQMLEKGQQPCDVARFLFDSIARALYLMAQNAQSRYGMLPLVFSGGVTANTIIRRQLARLGGAVFAPAELATDNAVGIAYLASLSEGIS